MAKTSKVAEKIPFKERSHAFKLKVVREIENGLISRNFASKKYLTSRSTIDYWYKKLSTDMNASSENKSLQKQVKKLKEEIEELEFVNRVHREALEEMLKKYGEDPKKSYAGQLLEFAKELERKSK